MRRMGMKPGAAPSPAAGLGATAVSSAWKSPGVTGERSHSGAGGCSSPFPWRPPGDPPYGVTAPGSAGLWVRDWGGLEGVWGGKGDGVRGFAPNQPGVTPKLALSAHPAPRGPHTAPVGSVCSQRARGSPTAFGQKTPKPTPKPTPAPQRAALLPGQAPSTLQKALNLPKTAPSLVPAPPSPPCSYGHGSEPRNDPKSRRCAPLGRRGGRGGHNRGLPPTSGGEGGAVG